MDTYVVGHKNPDTDSVIAAIALSQMRDGSKPAVAGEINKETEYLLARFGFGIPSLLPASEKKVLLVDTNNPDELAENLSMDEIVSIVDHHKMGGIKTSEPIVVTIRTVGSTNTVLYELAQKENFVITQNLAAVMIGAIISDTLKLTSPTTTEADKAAVSSLNEIAKVNLDQLADEMFAAKSDISSLKTEELLGKDCKVFAGDNGKTIAVGVWETVMPNLVMDRKTEILEGLKKMKADKGLDLAVFACVDILKMNSDFFAASSAEQEMLENIYGTKCVDSVLRAEGVVSRKKQMAPQIVDYIAKL